MRDRCLQTLSLTIIILLAVGFFKLNPIDNKELNEERFWALKTFAKPEYDMVIMGDSRVYTGVSPHAMSSVLPDYRILNFGYSLGGLNHNMYIEASSKLDPKSKIKTIMLGVTPISLTEKTINNFAFKEKQSMSREYFYLLMNFPSIYRFIRPLKLEKIIPHKFEKKIKKIFQPSIKKNNFGRRYSEFYDDGWAATWRIPENPTKYLEPFRKMFLEYKVSSDLVKDLLKQTEDWVRQGIHVYAFRPPSSLEMKKLEDELSGFNETILRNQFEAAGGIWLSFPTKKYHSHDASHLDKKSAIQLSFDCAKQIKSKEQIRSS